MGFFCPVRTFPFGQLFNVSVNIPNKVIKKRKKLNQILLRKRANVENALTLPSSGVRTVTIGCFGPRPFLVYPAMVRS